MSKRIFFKALAVVLSMSCASTYALTANPLLPLGQSKANGSYDYYNSPAVSMEAAGGAGYSPLWIQPGGFQYGATASYGWGGDNTYKHVSIHNLTGQNIVLKLEKDSCTDNTASRFNTYSWPPGSSNPSTARIPQNWYWSAKFALNSGDSCSVASGIGAQAYSYAVLDIYTAAPDTSLSQNLTLIGQMVLNYEIGLKSAFSVTSSKMQSGHKVTNDDGLITIH